jgi:hypothetical protein
VRATDPIETAWYHFPDIRERPELERKPNGPLDEPRVRRNFLTWAFFLAQVSAAEALLTGAAKAQGDDISENTATHSDPQFEGLPSEAVQGRFDVAEATVVAPPSSSVIAQNGDTGVQTHALPLSALAGHTPPVGAAVGAAGSGSQGPTIIGSGGSPNNSLPNMLPEIGGTEQIPPPPITVDIGLKPLLGFDVNIDVGGLVSANVGLQLDPNGLLGSLVGDVTHLLANPLHEVTDLVGSLTNDLGHLLNGDGLGLGDLLQTSPLNLSELTGLTLNDGIAGLLGQNGHSGASSASDAMHEPAVAAITGTSDAATQTLFGSGGVINILGGLTSVAQHDVLFAEGRHTDYSVALQDHATSDTGGGATSDITATVETPPADHQPAADTVIADLPHLDDLVARLTI